MLILGIETSCDETSAAVVEDGRKILSLVTATQIEAHKIYGGVVPELASRMHAESLGEVTREALKRSGRELSDLSYIAVTKAPGLLGSLLVGVTFANALALSGEKKCIGVNHLEAHIYSAFMEFDDLKAPVIALLVSGGHTVIVRMDTFGEYQQIGATLDDAAGEAFDKVSFVLGLGYPGGPAIEKAAEKGDECAFAFPRAMIRHKKKYDLSFSGLKTSVITKVRSLFPDLENMDDQTRFDVAASFQEAAVDTLVHKTMAAAESCSVSRIVIAGGVAANKRLQKKMKEACDKRGFDFFFPSLKLCGDNAAMIAGLAFHKTDEATEHVDDVSAVMPFESAKGKEVDEI